LSTTLIDESGASVRITDFAPRFRRHGRMFRPARSSGASSRWPARAPARAHPARFSYGRDTPQVKTESNHCVMISATPHSRDHDASICIRRESLVVSTAGDLDPGPDE